MMKQNQVVVVVISPAGLVVVDKRDESGCRFMFEYEFTHSGRSWLIDLDSTAFTRLIFVNT
jgi:hypothetical protein